MKIRLDFVTNSSSSSFIIAIRNDCTFEEMKNIIKQYKNNIIETAEMMDYEDNEYNANEIIDNISNKFLIDSKNYGIKLDDWNVYADTFSSEDEIDDCVIYNCFDNIETEKIKIRSCN
jgi:hypothetical protein